jgi:hypothetical protein
MNDSEHFDCPACRSHYRRIAASAAPSTTGRPAVSCLKCGHVLEGGGIDFVYKYFRVTRRHHAPDTSTE